MSNVATQKTAVKFIRLGLIAPIVVTAFAFVAWPRIGFKSQKDLLGAYRQDVLRNRTTLTYYRQRPYSAEFYSEGRAEYIEDPNALIARLDGPALHYVVTTPEEWPRVPDTVRAHLHLVAQAQHGRYQLYAYEPALPSH